MPTAALIISNTEAAFAAYMAVSELCDVLVVPSADRALKVESCVAALFIEAELLSPSTSRTMAERFPPEQTRWIILLPPEKPMFDPQTTVVTDYQVLYGPLTTQLAVRCLEGIIETTPAPTHPQAKAANDWTYQQ